MELPLGSERGDCSFEALKGASSGPLAQPPYPLLKAAWVLFTQDQSGSDRWQILVAGTCSMHVCVMDHGRLSRLPGGSPCTGLGDRRPGVTRGPPNVLWVQICETAAGARVGVQGAPIKSTPCDSHNL